MFVEVQSTRRAERKMRGREKKLRKKTNGRHVLTLAGYTSPLSSSGSMIARDKPLYLT